MHNTTANSNRASSSDGGTIYINSQGSTDSRVSITNCQFINNSANLGSGGALYESISGSNIYSSILT